MDFEADSSTNSEEDVESFEEVGFCLCVEEEIVLPLEQILEAVIEFLRQVGLEVVARVASTL